MAGERSFWTPVLCGAAIVAIGIGARQSFGIFEIPIAQELNVGRELWSFASALANDIASRPVMVFDTRPGSFRSGAATMRVGGVGGRGGACERAGAAATMAVSAVAAASFTAEGPGDTSL